MTKLWVSPFAAPYRCSREVEEATVGKRPRPRGSPHLPYVAGSLLLRIHESTESRDFEFERRNPSDSVPKPEIETTSRRQSVNGADLVHSAGREDLGDSASRGTAKTHNKTTMPTIHRGGHPLKYTIPTPVVLLSGEGQMLKRSCTWAERNRISAFIGIEFTRNLNKSSGTKPKPPNVVTVNNVISTPANAAHGVEESQVVQHRILAARNV